MLSPLPRPARATVLVVDDEPLNVAVLSELLSPEHRVLGARSGGVALQLLASHPVDLVLLDVMMPEMDGYQVLRTLRADPRTHDLPVIFITALGSAEDEERGLLMGASDYVTKPIQPAVVQARVRTHLEVKRSRDRLVADKDALEAEVARRVQESLVAQDLAIAALAELVETRDNETGNHILRTQSYVETLARELQRMGAFPGQLSEPQLQRMVKGAPMHDIGKIGIRDEILLKPGRLTEAEFNEMKRHAALGGDALERTIRKVRAEHPEADGDEPEALRYLAVARDIARCHHERWDGNGYPDGLRGVQIPLAARLMALADVYDALTSRRPYKEPWTHADTVAYIRKQSGSHFDPMLVEVFERLHERFEAIARQLAD